MMTRIKFISALLLCFSLISCKQMIDEVPEKMVSIDRDWCFNYFPDGDTSFVAPSAASFDDSEWTAIALPHTWMSYETTGDEHPFIAYATEREDSYWWYGQGWYRKRFTVDESLEGKKIFIEFDGIQKWCRVFLNGKSIFEHKGGYNSFCIDITPYINKENLLAVQVSSRRDDEMGTIPPATAGNFNVYGGIYRSARIVIKNRVYIPFQGSADYEGGTFVTTPRIKGRKANVRISTFVRNEENTPKNVTLVSTIVTPYGRKIARMSDQTTISEGCTFEFIQESRMLHGIRLWSPENPALYTIYSEVRSEAGELLASYTTPLGFRTYSWDSEAKTLVLNGKHIHIHGTNRHQDYPWLGDAVPQWLAEREMEDIRHGMNVNFMRTAHYPQDRYIYDFNDRNGIITVEELPNDKEIDFDRKVQEQNAREMVRRDRNHPSIFFWSVGNETSCAADSRWIHEEDSTRLIHERKAARYGDFVDHHASDLDMENLLRVSVRGWTDRHVKDLEPANTPKVPKSGQYAGTEEWQHTMARVQDGSIRGRIDGNIVCWLYADHGCDRIYKNAPLKNINYKGWVDLYGQPKYMYYLWQANYKQEAMVYIHPHFWQKKFIGEKKTIRVDSNCDKVVLLVNGKPVGARYPKASNFHTVEFEDVEIVEGTIEAKAYRKGCWISTELVMAGNAYALKLSAIRGAIEADRSGIDIVWAEVVDSNGVSVQEYSNDLRWSIEGEGKLLGPEIYRTDIDKNLENIGSGYIVPPVPNLVRSTGISGEITVRVESDGLIPAEITIISNEVSKESENGISQPVLEDEGRKAVTRERNYVSKEKIFVEMGKIYAPEQIDAASMEEYIPLMKRFVIERNPKIDSTCIEFGRLISELAQYMVNTHGELTEDDYNFMADKYNQKRNNTRYGK